MNTKVDLIQFYTFVIFCLFVGGMSLAEMENKRKLKAILIFVVLMGPIMGRVFKLI